MRTHRFVLPTATLVFVGSLVAGCHRDKDRVATSDSTGTDTTPARIAPNDSTGTDTTPARLKAVRDSSKLDSLKRKQMVKPK